MIIYPVYIDDIIPAFTNTIKIPFSANPAVRVDSITFFKLKIISIIDNTEIITLNFTTKEYDPQTKTGVINFTLNSNELTEATYYKMQLGCSDDDSYYSWSTVSTGRYLGKENPTFELKREGYTAIATYKTSLISEPLYNYRFIVSTDSDGNNIIKDSGWLIYNTDMDQFIDGEGITSIFTFILPYIEQTIYVKCYANTVNGYFLSDSFDLSFDLETTISDNFNVKQDKYEIENGYVEIFFNNNIEQNQLILLMRKEYNSIIWEPLEEVLVNAKETKIWKDNSVLQGQSYNYAIWPKEDSQKPILTASIIPKFEYIFLSDEERQLKIMFNPEISTFKDTIQESKIDTIGGQYPFFFKNNQVKYKEMSISGLLSYLIDEQHYFASLEELGNPVEKSTELSNENIFTERNFKILVLEWLNNGKPKLFRSPEEGNYIVRLMNISLSPNKTVGRMLHTFNSTAYEVMENSVKNLQDNNLLFLK